MGATYLAVYGTLRAGLALPDQPPELAELLADRGPCVLSGLLYDLGAYPGLRLGSGRVIGQLYELLDPPTALVILDEYEGYHPPAPESSLYLRVRASLLEPAVEAWTYVYNRQPDPGSVIRSGDWLRHRGGVKR